MVRIACVVVALAACKEAASPPSPAPAPAHGSAAPAPDLARFVGARTLDLMTKPPPGLLVFGEAVLDDKGALNYALGELEGTRTRVVLLARRIAAEGVSVIVAAVAAPAGTEVEDLSAEQCLLDDRPATQVLAVLPAGTCRTHIRSRAAWRFDVSGLAALEPARVSCLGQCDAGDRDTDIDEKTGEAMGTPLTHPPGAH